jgi:hypothetical protein
MREIDDLPATVWWGVLVRQSSVHTCTVQCTRAGILCSSGLVCQNRTCPNRLISHDSIVHYNLYKEVNNMITENFVAQGR